MPEMLQTGSFRTLLYFLWAASFQLIGAWYLWNSMRGDRSIAIAVLGCVMVVAGALVMALTQLRFGRAYLAYAGVLAVMAVLWNWYQTRTQPDIIDFVGGIMVLGGIGIMVLVPRP